MALAVAVEIGSMGCFVPAEKLQGHSGLCPRVYQSGVKGYLGLLSKGLRQ